MQSPAQKNPVTLHPQALLKYGWQIAGILMYRFAYRMNFQLVMVPVSHLDWCSCLEYVVFFLLRGHSEPFHCLLLHVRDAALIEVFSGFG